MLREAFYVDGFGNDPELILTGIEWLQNTCQEEGITTAYMVVPKNDTFTSDAIREALGDEAANALSRGRQVSLGNGVTMEPISAHALPFRIHGPVLAVYCLFKQLTQIDTAASSQSMGIVAWLEAEGQAWIRKHNAKPIGGQVTTLTEARHLSNPVVEQALLNLTSMVNLSTGIAHPRDRDRAVHMFRILKRNNEDIDFAELSGWLTEHHWMSSYVDEVVELGQAIYGGKKRQAGENPWQSRVIFEWRKRARESA